MENTKVPKKVERHAIKAVNLLCEGSEDTYVSEAEILNQVRYQMRNLVPMANIESILHKCLLELSARCIIHRIDDNNFGIYSSDRDERSSCKDDSDTDLQRSLVSPRISFTVSSNEVIPNDEQGNDCFIFQNNGKNLPLPMQIKTEMQEDDTGDGGPQLHLQA
uniref:Uncharacterized protein n=1 Tax=Glossina palpalis gambiensis TaxID=67801 RepID=A0A1B0BSX3_9MUSC